MSKLCVICLPSELLAKRHNVFVSINSIVSNRRMIVVVNDSCYVAYDVVHLSLIAN